MRDVPLLEPQLPLPAEQQHELDHGGVEWRNTSQRRRPGSVGKKMTVGGRMGGTVGGANAKGVE